MNTFFTALRALLYGGAFVLFFGWVASKVRIFDDSIGILVPAWTPVLGILLIGLGGILALSCLAVFVFLGRGTAAPFDPPKKFVAVGPYRYLRNPMYVGGFGMIFGYGLYCRSVSIFLFSLFVSVLVHGFVVLLEEPDLERRFEESYLEYKKAVNRWIPRWK